jgi:hypothetical protein
MRGSHDAEVHFGLGTEPVASVRVELPSGKQQRFENLKANQMHTLTLKP